MAIKLVQGLIDVGPSSGGSGSSQKVNPETEKRGGNAQSAVVAQAAVKGVTTTLTSDNKALSEAAVNALRGKGGKLDGKPLRDTREVDSLAYSVSERISSSRDESGVSHSRLSPEVARPHFQ
jgi:hypothetical protein